MQDHFFSVTTTAPWNKLFLRNFVKEKKLFFQDTRSANDVSFVITALAESDRVAMCDVELITYRQNNKDSLQSTQARDPEAFYRAARYCKDDLIARGLFLEVEHSFINQMLAFVIYNLHTFAGNRATHELVYESLRSRWLDSLGLAGKPRTYFSVYPDSLYDELDAIQRLDYGQYLFWQKKRSCRKKFRMQIYRSMRFIKKIGCVIVRR